MQSTVHDFPPADATGATDAAASERRRILDAALALGERTGRDAVHRSA